MFSSVSKQLQWDLRVSLFASSFSIASHKQKIPDPWWSPLQARRNAGVRLLWPKPAIASQPKPCGSSPRVCMLPSWEVELARTKASPRTWCYTSASRLSPISILPWLSLDLTRPTALASELVPAMSAAFHPAPRHGRGARPCPRRRPLLGAPANSVHT